MTEVNRCSPLLTGLGTLQVINPPKPLKHKTPEKVSNQDTFSQANERWKLHREFPTVKRGKEVQFQKLRMKENYPSWERQRLWDSNK